MQALESQICIITGSTYRKANLSTFLLRGTCLICNARQTSVQKYICWRPAIDAEEDGYFGERHDSHRTALHLVLP